MGMGYRTECFVLLLRRLIIGFSRKIQALVLLMLFCGKELTRALTVMKKWAPRFLGIINILGKLLEGIRINFRQIPSLGNGILGEMILLGKRFCKMKGVYLT